MGERNFILFCILSAYVFGSGLFLIGFFPLDFQNDLHSSDPPRKLNGSSLLKPKQQYEKVIFVIIDALRYDFVDKEKMPHTSRYCKLKIKTNSPTVTLPRIKSLTSGTISNFLDVILNLGKSQPLQDSILHKLHKRGDKIVFFGDFTWVDLFSKQFKRYESNTDSFYLTEYNEADNNITKNLRKELNNLTSWDFLILHYIGLDRIGHMGSSNGKKINFKLKEMDDVVEFIGKAIFKKETTSKYLLLITADHGMRNGGGHGGSSPEEVYVPLITSSQICFKHKSTIYYNQVDIAPTLSILLDVPLPSNSIGEIIPELIEGLNPQEKLYALYYNSKFLLEKAIVKFGHTNVKVEDYFVWFNTATYAHTTYLAKLLKENTSSSYLFEKAKLNYIRSTHKIAYIFAKSYLKIDYGMIFLGIILTGLLTTLVVIICLTTANLTKKIDRPFTYLGRIFLSAVSINTFCCITRYVQTSNVLKMFFTIIPIFIIILLILELIKLVAGRLILTTHIPISIAFGVVFPIFSLCSTSFIEEEHQTWYYIGLSFFLSLLWKAMYNTRFNVTIFSRSTKWMWRDVLVLLKFLRQFLMPFVALFITIFVRRLNQTGDKWMRVPDINDWFAESDKIYLSFFLIISLLLVTYQLKEFNTKLQMVACILSCVSIYWYRGVIGAVVFFQYTHFNSFLVLPIYWSTIIYILASSYISVILEDKKCNQQILCKLLYNNLTVITLVSALLHKPHNVFLVFAIHFLLKYMYNMCDNFITSRQGLEDQVILIYKVFATNCVCKMFYFFQGNSNSLATIDLNPGFIGLTNYNPVFVGIMITVNTYFADIYGFFYLLAEVHQENGKINISKETNESYNCVLKKNNFSMVTIKMSTLKLLSTSAYMILMTYFRNHLFIYTVFSPKILYECFAILLFYFYFSITYLYLQALQKIILFSS